MNAEEVWNSALRTAQLMNALRPLVTEITNDPWTAAMHIVHIRNENEDLKNEVAELKKRFQLVTVKQ